MTTPLFNIGGLASGLDTNSIIQQLMALERIPVQQVQARRSSFQARNTAWSQINTRLAAVQTKMAALDDPSDWGKLAKATSSNTGAVGVSVTGTPAQTAVSFTVARLATSHQIASSGEYTSSSDLVGTGTFSFTAGGEQLDVATTASTSVADLAKSINNLGAGVTASVLAIDTNRYKLMLRSDESGDDSVFTVDAAPASLGSFSTVEAGQDAQIVLGSGVDAITLERSSNVVSDMIDGVTLTLTDTTTSAVTVTVNRDLDAAVTKVSEFVKELNATLATLTNLTRTAAESGPAAGPLASDSTARQLKLSLRGLLSGSVEGVTGAYRTAASLGISLTREGDVTFDETKLRAALETDFQAVESLFSRQTPASDTRVTVSRASGSSLEGTHSVSISQAATRAMITGSAYTSPVADQSFTIDSGSKTASVLVPTAATIDDAIEAINTALTDAGITTLTATNASGQIALTETRYGSAPSFTISGDDPWGLVGTHTGLNVAGTIGGIAAEGTGRSLSGTDTMDGLLLSITADTSEVLAAGGSLALGEVTVRSGLAAKFVAFLDEVTGTGGLIDRATDRWDSQIKLADQRVEELEARLVRKEGALRRQFTALESAMGRLSSMSAQLTSGLQGLSQNWR